MAGLRGKVIVVTGAGQGIGKGIARRVLADGGIAVVAEKDAEAGEEVVRELSKGGEVRFIQADVADEASVAAMVRATVEQFGRLDGLVNNAAIAAPENSPIEKLDLADWNRVIANNLTSVFLCAKHAAPYLRRVLGAMVNIASTRALQSEPHTEGYAASKGGVLSLTHALAVSLGPDVRVNCISPGWIEVGAWKKASSRVEPKLRSVDHGQHPAGRVGQPDDIAGLAAFLLSDDSRFITAQNFVVDGGMTRKMIYAP